MAALGAGVGDGLGAGMGAGGVDAGGMLFVAGAAGSGFGEHAATNAIPTKGVISMKRRREVDTFINIFLDSSENLAWVANTVDWQLLRPICHVCSASVNSCAFTGLCVCVQRAWTGFRLVFPACATVKPGLYANIHAKQERIAKGSGEHMNKSGSKDAPSIKDFEKAAKTEKKPPSKVSK